MNTYINAYVQKLNELLELNIETTTYMSTVNQTINTRLRKISAAKSSHLCVSADLESPQKILDLVGALSSHIVAVKIHVNCIKFASFEDRDVFLNSLRDLSSPDSGDFLIIMDFKFCDIGSIVRTQFEPYAPYADLVTVHCVSGPGIFTAMRELCVENNCALLPIAEMSSKDNLITSEYTASVLGMANIHRDIIAGFISQHNHLPYDDFTTWTPGIHLDNGGDNLGQQYNTPKTCKERGTDVMIVGRGIYQASDPVAAAKKYNSTYLST